MKRISIAAVCLCLIGMLAGCEQKTELSAEVNMQLEDTADVSDETAEIIEEEDAGNTEEVKEETEHENEQFEASEYVQAVLDNMYKNDSEAFVKMGIGTKEEAEKIYREWLLEAMGDVPEGLTDEQYAEYEAVHEELFSMTEYTVGEAKEQEDGSYIVTVTYKKLNAVGPATQAGLALSEEMMAEWTSALEADKELPSDEEMNRKIVLIITRCLKEALENATYEEPQTMDVRVTKDESSAVGYVLNEEDSLKLQEHLLLAE